MNYQCNACKETYSTDEMHGFMFNNKTYCEMCDVPSEEIKAATQQYLANTQQVTLEAQAKWQADNNYNS